MRSINRILHKVVVAVLSFDFYFRCEWVKTNPIKNNNNNNNDNNNGELTISTYVIIPLW